MSERGSVFQKGGGGTNFEQSIQTAFLTTLIVRGNAPCIPNSEVIEVACQVTSRGYETDDLLVVVKSRLGEHKLLIQAKHNISFTLKNEIFKEVLKGFWSDYSQTSIFDRSKDKLLIVKSGMTMDERNHLKSLFNWANNHLTATSFINEVNRIKGKKQRLEMFRTLLKEANDNIALTDLELWEFLRCLDVLEYDFLNTGSVDKTYFLNLIKLSKDTTSSSNEREIWDSIFTYAANLNKDGGSATLESIKKESFFESFDVVKLAPYNKAIAKLKSDSQEILRPIKLTIGDSENIIKISRPGINEKIVDTISQFPITIVTGKPGVGKSAKIKELLELEFSNASFFVFRADQFNSPTIANVFSSQGVTETIQDIFCCISLIPEKLIFIDSLEKLLEADPECAFKQLLALVEEYPDIKIIGSARKYSIDLIVTKFGISNKDLGLVEIPLLNTIELNSVTEKFPQLISIVRNEKIKKLLQSPKYLDFAVLATTRTSDDYSNVSLVEFKNKLWNSLVVDSSNTRNGLPIKRENAFMEIAVRRAKEMKLFTRPLNSDSEALALLENDEIVFQENQNRKYSPTHDILEDWALVRYVSLKFEEYTTPVQLFKHLGNEPAIRRAFRLWIEDYLDDEFTKVNDFIKASIKDPSIDRYWADEILIAVFRSEKSDLLFNAFETELLDNNAIFLNRSIHLIRTCCRETDPSRRGFTFLTPVGSGWSSILHFIEANLDKLDDIKYSITGLIVDWKNKIGQNESQPDQEESLAVRNIVVKFLDEIEREEELWKQEFTNRRPKRPIELVKVLFRLANISSSEIESLVKRAFEYKLNMNVYRLGPFYEAVLECCLTGFGNHEFLKAMPELVVETAWKEWKYIKPKEEGKFRYNRVSRLRDEECWGMKFGNTYHPPSIYQTPFYNLLLSHPKIGFNFIIDFINYSCDFYVNSDCEYKRNISQIDIKLNDGTVLKKWASFQLWAAYRGISVTTNIMESLLKSLEKYLLNIAAQNSEKSKQNLKRIFDLILNKTNNVSTISVLNSVAIACPDIVEEAMLPLLKVREFYQWDIDKTIQESDATGLIGVFDPLLRKEIERSNKLPHRKKGLMDFVISYQFENGSLIPEFFKIFDELQSEVKEEDLVWKKMLSQLDLRKWEVVTHQDKLVAQPKFENDVKEFMNSGKEYAERQNKSSRFFMQLWSTYNGKESIEFARWVEIYNFYTKEVEIDMRLDRPCTLAFLGLSQFLSIVDTEQKEWCISTLKQSVKSVVKKAFRRSFEQSKEFNFIEKEVILSSFHLLLQNAMDEEEQYDVITALIYILFAPIHESEMKEITNYVNNVFSKQFPHEMRKVWFSLIQYSKFSKENPYYIDDHDSEKIIKIKEKETAFICENVKAEKVSLNLPEISFQDCRGDLLCRAFTITPFDLQEECYKSFIKHFISLLTSELKSEHINSLIRRQEGGLATRQIVNHTELRLTELLLQANSSFAKEVFDLIVTPVYKTDFERKSTSILEFTTTILKNVIYHLDNFIANSKDQELNSNLISNFWELWLHFFNTIKSSGKPNFIDILLLDINWNDIAIHWKPLEGNKDKYKEMVREVGKYHPSSVQKVFSTIGEKTFLPDSISWLVGNFKNNPNAIVCLLEPSAERLIQRLFYNHISKIKKNNNLIDDYLWILDTMVTLGSSKAYLFRENVITYKSLS